MKTTKTIKVMKKRCAFIIAAIMLCCVCLTVIGSASETEDLRLFDMKGEYIVKDPNSGEDAQDWYTILGKSNENMSRDDNFVTSEKGVYPLEINSSSPRSVYYYLAGSNNIDEVLTDHPEYLDYLENDFVIEYDVKYEDLDNSRISIVHSFNYKYFIDAYISPDGSGDIAAVSPEGETSLLSSGSMLDPNDGKELVAALYGKEREDLTDVYVNIAVRVSVNNDKMPEAIEIYINGLKAGEADKESLSSFVEDHTPEYEIKKGEVFPKETLGNIVALKCDSETKCQLDNIRIYNVDENATAPSEASVARYAEVYGNESYDLSIPEVTEENTAEEPTEAPTAESTTEDSTEGNTEGNTDGETEGETQTSPITDDDGSLDVGVLIALIVIFAVVIAALVVVAVIIIKKRK